MNSRKEPAFASNSPLRKCQASRERPGMFSWKPPRQRAATTEKEARGQEEEPLPLITQLGNRSRAGGPSYREAKGGDVQPALLVLLRVGFSRSPTAWNSSLTASPLSNHSGDL